MITEILNEASELIDEATRRPTQTLNLSLEEAIKKLLDLGGVIIGGAYASRYYQYPIKAKDLDIGFRDREKFIQAHSIRGFHPIDICWYRDCPYGTHDLSVTMGYLDSDLEIHSDPKAIETKKTRVLHFEWKNIVDPKMSLYRTVKYCRRFGLKIPTKELVTLLAFCETNYRVDQFTEFLI